MYNLTRFQKAKKIENPFGLSPTYDFGKIQFIGSFKSLEEAQNAILINGKSLSRDEFTNEKYSFIVIEDIEEGLFVPESYRELYMFNGVKYHKIDDKDIKNYTGFCYH